LTDDNGGFVSNRELKAAMNGMRWEFRALLALAFAAGRVLPSSAGDTIHGAAGYIVGMIS
jgi:hypothetical protein